MSDEGATGEARRQIAGMRECKAERGSVGPKRVVRHDRPGDKVGPLRLDPLVDVLAVVAVGPAIEAAVPDRRHVVGHEIAADLVTLVDRGPKRAAYRLPGETDGVAETRGIDPVPARPEIDLP